MHTNNKKILITVILWISPHYWLHHCSIGRDVLPFTASPGTPTTTPPWRNSALITMVTWSPTPSRGSRPSTTPAGGEGSGTALASWPCCPSSQWAWPSWHSPSISMAMWKILTAPSLSHSLQSLPNQWVCTWDVPWDFKVVTLCVMPEDFLWTPLPASNIIEWALIAQSFIG